MTEETANSQQDDPGDEAVAKRIRYAVNALNLLLGIAAKRGLQVAIESHDISGMGEYVSSRRIYEARITRSVVL